MGNTKNIMSLRELKRWLRHEKDLFMFSQSPIAHQIKKQKINLIKKEIQIRSKQICTPTCEGWYEHDHLNKEVMREYIKHWTYKINKGETL
jgi:methyl coenzyme M reductase subunit C-like uncharacterized protein (methanogenesis marker protein 7)